MSTYIEPGYKSKTYKATGKFTHYGNSDEFHFETRTIDGWTYQERITDCKWGIADGEGSVSLGNGQKITFDAIYDAEYSGLIYDTVTPNAAWASGVLYKSGDKCSYVGYNWTCTGCNIQTWQPYYYWNVGDKCVYDNQAYICTTYWEDIDGVFDSSKFASYTPSDTFYDQSWHPDDRPCHFDGYIIWYADIMYPEPYRNNLVAHTVRHFSKATAMHLFMEGYVDPDTHAISWALDREGTNNYVSYYGSLSVDWSYEITGSADLVWEDDETEGEASLFHDSRLPYYLGMGRDGELAVHGKESIKKYDRMISPQCTVVLGGDSYTWTMDSSDVMTDNSQTLDLYAFCSMRGQSYAIHGTGWYCNASDMGWAQVPMDVHGTDKIYAEATHCPSFRSAPEVSRTYKADSTPAGLTGYGYWVKKSPTQTNPPIYTFGTTLEDGKMSLYGGIADGTEDIGFSYGVYWIHSDSYTVYAGKYEIDYAPSYFNMYTNTARTDVPVRGLETHPREASEYVEDYIYKYTRYRYIYDRYDDYGVFQPYDFNSGQYYFGDIVKYGSSLYMCKTSHIASSWDASKWNACGAPSDPRLILTPTNNKAIYKGKFHTANCGDMLDLPNDGEWTAHGGMGVIHMESVWDTAHASGTYGGEAGWSQPAIHEPTHPCWQPFPEGMEYATGSHSWICHYGNYKDQSDSANGMPWYDRSIDIGVLGVSPAITFNFPNPTADDAVVATPITFPAYTWSASGATVSNVGDYTQMVISASGSVLLHDFFSANVRFTGSRYATIDWIATVPNAGFELRIGTDTSYHSWFITANADINTLMTSQIDMCYPDSSTGAIINDMAQGIIPYERPNDRSSIVVGLEGERLAEDQYDWVLPPGLAIGRVCKVKILPTVSTGTLKFSNISLIWKSQSQGGFRKIYSLYHQVFVDDRDPSSYVLQPTGSKSLTSAINRTRQEELYLYPKLFIVIDGAIVMEMPAGRLWLDYDTYMDNNGDYYPSPMYRHSAFKLVYPSGSPYSIQTYPLANYDRRVVSSYKGNGIFSYTINTAGMTEFVKNNCFVSFLQGGCFDLFGKTSQDLSMDLKINTLYIKQGFGDTGIGAIQKVYRGCAYGVCKERAGSTITMTNKSPNTKAETRTVNVNKLGIWQEFAWDTKTEIGYNPDNADVSIPVDNRYITRKFIMDLRTELKFQGMDTCKDKVGFLYKVYTKDKNIKYGRSTDHGKTWSTVSLTTDNNSFAPTIEVDTNSKSNKLILSYVKSDTKMIVKRYSTDNGATWNAEANIVAGEFPFIKSIQGFLLMYYYEDGKIKIKRSTDFGATWDAAQICVSDAAEDAMAVEQTSEKSGNVVLIYRDTTDNIKHVKSNSNGNPPYTSI